MKHNQKIHLFSFYTEGKYLDNGVDLRDVAIEFENVTNRFFNSVTLFSPRKLISLNPKWQGIFSDRSDAVNQWVKKNNPHMIWNKSWAALNFMQWKSELFYYMLTEVKNVSVGDVVFFHDIDMKKYPDYKRGVNKWESYVRKNISNIDVLLFDDDGTKVEVDIKKELIEKYKCEKFKNMPHVWAGAVAIKKNENGVAFVKKWVEMTSDIDNISQITLFSNTRGFKWHSQEQACLSLLYYLNKNKDIKIKVKFLWGKRVIPPNLFQFLKWIIGKSIKNKI